MNKDLFIKYQKWEHYNEQGVKLKKVKKVSISSREQLPIKTL